MNVSIMQLTQLESELLHYLVEQEFAIGDKLPNLAEMSSQLGMSVSKLREQLEVARMLGVISVRPRLGIQREAFDFKTAVLSPILFSLATSETQFAQLNELRKSLEIAFWQQAVSQLDADDLAKLDTIVNAAQQKLNGHPIHIPTREHRQLHLAFFQKLQNPFIIGLMEAYWDAYDASELTRFKPYQYWLEVWHYHQQIVEAIRHGDVALAQQYLIDHFSLLTLPQTVTEENKVAPT